MLMNFLYATKKYQKAVLGLVIVSMVLVMSQISLHALMLQQKTSANYQPLTISADVSIEQHCAQTAQNIKHQENQTIQCQSFLSILDSLSSNTSLSIDLPQLGAILFFIPLIESTINTQSFHQLNILNSVIKTLFPSITIKLHSFLI